MNTETKPSVKDSVALDVKVAILKLIDKEFKRLLVLAKKCEDFEFDEEAPGYIHIFNKINVNEGKEFVESVYSEGGVERTVKIVLSSNGELFRVASLKTATVDQLMLVLEGLREIKKDEQLCRDDNMNGVGHVHVGNFNDSHYTVAPKESV